MGSLQATVIVENGGGGLCEVKFSVGTYEKHHEQQELIRRRRRRRR